MTVDYIRKISMIMTMDQSDLIIGSTGLLPVMAQS